MHQSAVCVAQADPALPLPRALAQIGVEAGKARAFGKRFVAAILESLARTLAQAPALARRIETWPGDLASAGVIFRLNAGVHALARSGRFAMLRQIYNAADMGTEPDPVVLDQAMVEALVLGEAELQAWLQGPTQTNEVARLAGLAAVLAELSAVQAMPCRVLELGASAGLNLNLAHYAITLGCHQIGPSASAVRIAPRWHGPAPCAGPVTIADASGVDLCPLHVADPGDAERLHAYVWPGERARAERLRAAIALARRHPPQVEQGSAAAWLEHRLASPPPAGERRVVFHAMALQYMAQEERDRIDRLIAASGAQAGPDRPLVRVAIEWNAARSDVEVQVTGWNGGPRDGVATLAARCHPYAEWFDWYGLG